MHIESVTLQNFRCYGAKPTTITLDPNVTTLIGANGSGKTAFIEALRRLFGVSREERTLTRADIHFGPDENPNTIDERQVVIDVVFAFPELEEDGDGAQTVAEVFKVMTATAPGEPLKARLRLEALWKRGESFADEIETALFWILHLEDVEFGEDGAVGLDKQRLHGSDRGKIQLVYMPATRDGSAISRQALRQLLRRLERSGDFDDETKDEITEVSEDLQSKVEELAPVSWITERLIQNWNKLHSAKHLSNPKLTVVSQEFTQLLRSLTAKFSPAPDGRERGIEELSEGQASLFFMSLAATLAQLEVELSSGEELDGFNSLEMAPPALTIYAVEEPESHLAPFYLSRLMQLLQDLCGSVRATGIVTSHAPGVLRRVEPEAIRHFRLDLEHLITYVQPITLPDQEAGKYVRQAVMRQPEIYFANLVILGEGDSEETVLPRMAKALGTDLDPSFVAFAPLGGRHVNHFWRLLADLNIPFITLLDLDLGRSGAGGMRLKYAYDQLSEIEEFDDPDWVNGDPATSQYWRTRGEVGIRRWRNWFAERGIFFSYPLDLDLMMIRAYPSAYGMDDLGEVDDADAVAASVFGQGGGLADYEAKALPEDAPSEEELALYDLHFKKRSKPDSHIAALAELTDEELTEECPAPIASLIEKAKELLGIVDDNEEV